MSFKINLVNYELGQNNGILSKYANKMNEELLRLGHDSFITQQPRGGDIVHHINYLPYRFSPKVNTLMITHIFEGYKLEKLKEHIKTSFGICFSDETREWLIEKGLPKDKLTTILPAHDELPRKKKKVFICTNVYPDGCKREMMGAFLMEKFGNDFNFTIMGKGWEKLIKTYKLKVKLYPEFNESNYYELLSTSDYLLYFGKDEGAMSVLDAKQVGLQVIAPNVGFHKDLDVDYPFESQEELNNILIKLVHNPVEDWTWANYVKNHLKIWEKLLS